MATNVKATEAKKTEVKKTPVKATAEKAATTKTATAKAPKAKLVKEDTARNRRKVLRGVVVSNKMEKTGVVEITRKLPHPLYKKVVTKTTRFKFHDEKNECSIGDTVKIIESRPISGGKRWVVESIVEKAR